MTDAHSAPARPVCNYFVDEAGDGTLFGRKGHVILGQQGCSKFFMLGLAEIAGPEKLAADFAALRKRLLVDPYFIGVPSMRPETNKTALSFHATDDIPEVRREVYGLLLKHDIRFYAVVRDKRSVLEYVRQRNEREASYRYHPNELYDHMVRRLFRDRLHQQESYVIWFARRGMSDRTAMLRDAIAAARRRFTEQFGIASNAQVEVRPEWAFENAGLQAADYLLWAVQRLYGQGEDRFIRYIWPLVRLVHDADDTRRHQYGEYYTKDRPLTLAAAKQEPEI